MRCIYLVWLLLATLVALTVATKLSRRKRYLSFPEGSTLSIAICMQAQSMIWSNNQIWTEALNWGISYNLPNDTTIVRDYVASIHQKRTRRDLYHKIETIISAMGYEGRACIEQAICEAGRHFATRAPHSENLLEALIRTIFRLPNSGNLLAGDDEYQRAHKVAHDELSDKECYEMFPGCSFSLIDAILYD